MKILQSENYWAQNYPIFCFIQSKQRMQRSYLSLKDHNWSICLNFSVGKDEYFVSARQDETFQIC